MSELMSEIGNILRGPESIRLAKDIYPVHQRRRLERATLLGMTIGTTVAARAIVRRADALGRVRVTLIVSNTGDASESHELGPYDSRVRAQSVADVAVDILRRKAKECGSFSGEEVRQAVLSAEGTTGGPRL